jgi:outer membrane protein TolC
LQKTEIDLKNLENTIDFEQQQAQISLQNAVDDLEVQQENMALAQEIFRVAQVKYKEGVGSTLEVVDAETAYKEAETNYYGALYDALVAKVDFDKATGVLEASIGGE